MKTLIENILILFKRFDIPIILFFVAVLTVIGIYKGWIYIIGLITLAIIGVAIFVVAMLVKDYLDEKQTKIKSPYFKFFIVRLTWVGLFALVFSLVIKLIPCGSNISRSRIMRRNFNGIDQTFL